MLSYPTPIKVLIFSTGRGVLRISSITTKQFGNDQHCYSCHWTGVLAIYPFQPGPTVNVGRAANTLGPDYGEWLALNKSYARAATDKNDKINKKDKSNWVKVVGAPTLDQSRTYSRLRTAHPRRIQR